MIKGSQKLVSAESNSSLFSLHPACVVGRITAPACAFSHPWSLWTWDITGTALVPGACEHVTSQGPPSSLEPVKLWHCNGLRWISDWPQNRDYLGLSMWLTNHRVLKSRKGAGESVVCCEKDSTCHCWLWRETGPGAKEARQPLEPEKARKHSPRSLQKEHSSADTMIYLSETHFGLLTSGTVG